MTPLRLVFLALGILSSACIGFTSGGGSAAGGGASSGGGGASSGGGSASSGGGSARSGGGSSDLDHPLTPGNPGTADVRLEVVSTQGRHAISPLIYGTNQPASPAMNRYGLQRMGGNRLTAYNWENNASNAGVDYIYENDGYLSGSATPGAAVTGALDSARASGAAAILTIPIVDFVAADKSPGGDVRNSANYLDTRFKKNHAAKGSALSLNPDATDDVVYQDEFVNWVRANANGVQVLFSLDNEPDLWFDTHPEVHPDHVTYAELVSRTVTYASAVKATWPLVPVTGFVSYGWYGYVTLQDAPDAQGDFTDYFLEELKAAGTSKGLRLIDYLDLHWYPEATGSGRITGTDTSSASIIARVQAPRSLWDPTYKETSWIENSLNEPIDLIPRMKAKIAAHYPGTKLAITEWNYGAGGHISGAVATADVLGVFGREEVGLGAYWKLNGAEPFADAAFLAFRNYDGAGHGFGDTSLAATSSSAELASIYASVDAANPERTVLVVINKDTAAHSAALTVAHPTRYSRVKVFTLTSAGSSLVPAPDVTAVDVNAFRYTMPALSVSVLVPTP